MEPCKWQCSAAICEGNERERMPCFKIAIGINNQYPNVIERNNYKYVVYPVTIVNRKKKD